MKKTTITILILFLYSAVFSQERVTKTKRISFSIFSEYRITPVYLEGFSGTMDGGDGLTPVFYAQDEQLSGTAMGFEVGYSFRKINLSLIFSQSFRYDHIYFEQNTFAASGNSAVKSVNDFITDYHFILEKSFRIKNDHILSIRAGYALMNRGTAYALSEQSSEFGGQANYTVSHRDFHVSAFNAGVGYRKNKWNLALGGYFTDKHKYNQPSQLLIPYIKLGYRIFSE